MKKEKHPAILEAEEMLKDINEIVERINKLKQEADEEMRKVKDTFAPVIQVSKDNLARNEKKLKDHLRKYRGVFFAEGDTKYIEGGVVYVKLIQAVRRARNVTVELLEKFGFDDGVKIEKSVNWEKIENWPDEKLVMIGTERTEKEEFGYEIKTSAAK